MSSTISKNDNVNQLIYDAFRRSRNHRNIVDKFVLGIMWLCSLTVLIVLFFIIFHIFQKGATSVNVDFFIHLPKPVGEIGGGMANAIVGTLTLLGIAIVFGVPIGLGAGIYLSEYSSQGFAQILRFIVDIMNGIPSIIYGIFAYTILVLTFKSFSALSGGVALGIMMIPMITRTTEGFIKMVPVPLREAGLALGIPKWKITLDIVLPSALGGIATGVMVSLARVAGETAPLLFTAFGNQFWNHSIMQPIAALPLQIFSFAISPFDDWHRQAWAGALVLIAIVFIMNILANFFVSKQNKLMSGEK